MSNFETASQLFIRDGDFLNFTRQYDLSIPQPLVFQKHNFKVELLAAGILLLEPKSLITTTDIIISTGIHGDETAPIEMACQCIADIILGKQDITCRILFIIGNPIAMNTGERFIDENLNRLFSGHYRTIPTCYEGRRAETIELHVNAFFNQHSITQVEAPQTPNDAQRRQRYHYDLHTAIKGSKYEKFAVYPFREKGNWQSQQLQRLYALDIKTIIFGNAPTTTFSYFTANVFDANAFTVELGQLRPFGQNYGLDLTKINRGLRRLMAEKPLVLQPFDNKDFHLFQILCQITRRTKNFRFHIPADTKNFTSFPVGTLIAEDQDRQYITSLPNEAIVFPNMTVQIGHRAGLMVLPTTV
ncbi:MAG: succinylglutamate desuccinylase [Pseudomonadales bacterium]|nr:succinylglutamate desuccinylase [Pseudomonadales bacterium]